MAKVLVIWDWDNTLSDSLNALHAAHVDVCDRYGLPAISRDEVLHAISGEGGSLFWESIAEKERQNASDYYYVCSGVRLPQQADLFDETIDILEMVEASGAAQVVISNQMKWLLDIEVERCGVAKYFKRVVGRTDALKKPMAEFLERALDGLTYDRCVVVGDGVSDMLMAKELGAKAILVRAGDLSKPVSFDAHVRSHSELYEHLKQVLGEK